MKDILIIAQYISTESEKGNGRFTYLANMLAEQENNVEIVTTSFSHINKKKRDITVDTSCVTEYRLTMINELGYSKNVCMKRFLSHFILSKNLKKYLKNRNHPDVIYCAVPSLDVAGVAAEYAGVNNIKFIIDVQDLWPDGFSMVFNFPIISNIIYTPMMLKANYIYSMADEIVAVSQTYVDRALRINKKCKIGHSVFLGTDLNMFDKAARDNNILVDKPKNEIWMGYVGTLGHSYDLISIIDAMVIIKNQGIFDLKFIVIGDGPLKLKFKEYAEKSGANVEFLGKLPYDKMIGILSACDIAVNPITKGAAGSIINKHADYAAAGLPVINTQECEEYRDLINCFKFGLNCRNGDARDISEKIKYLYENKNTRAQMGKNSRKLAEEKFDRRKTYIEIVNMILGLEDV